MKAIWKGHIIVESDDTVIVEGNHCFPFDSVDRSLLIDNATTSVCSWKGTANDYSLQIDGETNPDAVWHCAEPKPAAVEINGRIAFRSGVEIQDEDTHELTTRGPASNPIKQPAGNRADIRKSGRCLDGCAGLVQPNPHIARRRSRHDRKNLDYQTIGYRFALDGADTRCPIRFCGRAGIASRTIPLEP